MIDPFFAIDLLLQGPRGWAVLALGAGVTALTGWKAYRRIRIPRPATAAFIGGSGRLDAQTVAEAAKLMSVFAPLDAELAAIKAKFMARRLTPAHMAERVLKISEAMRVECQRLDDLNIVFTREHDHADFLAGIRKRRKKAADLHHVANIAKRKTEEAVIASLRRV